jgi:hypothetical protein
MDIILNSLYTSVRGANNKTWIDIGFATKFLTKGFRSKRRSSPCIFQVVVSLSIRSVFITWILYYIHQSLTQSRDRT